MLTLDPLKVLFPALVSFIIGLLVAPTVIRFLAHYRIWKKKSVSKTIDGKDTTITALLHNDEERQLLRMGGSVVWIAVFSTAIIFWLVSKIHPTE